MINTNSAAPGVQTATPASAVSKTGKTAPNAASKRKATAPLKKVPVKKVTAKAPAKKSVVHASKPAAKVPTKVSVKAPAKTPVKTGAAVTSKILASAKPKVSKPLKAKKPKLVRDSFTIPKLEYLVMDELKQRATKLAFPIKKSELLRAGIKALAAMSDQAFITALKSVPAIKTGRPAKD